MVPQYLSLGKCGIFKNIPANKYYNVLTCLNGKKQRFPSGSTIVDISEQKRATGVVLEGIVELVIYDEVGSQVNVDHISSGETFGAAAACSQRSASPTRLSAVTDCDILFLDFSKLLSVSDVVCPYKAQVTVNLLQEFARENLFLNQRLRILAQKRLRDKIKVYFQNTHISEDGVLNLPFSRNEWADFLYVDRSALCRELSRMRSEGILSYRGRIIILHDKAFLL